MAKTITIITNRVAPSEFNVTTVVDGVSNERLFDQANSAYATHVTLRELLYEYKDDHIELNTNAHAVITDIQGINEGNASKSLAKILAKVMKERNVTINPKYIRGERCGA